MAGANGSQQSWAAVRFRWVPRSNSSPAAQKGAITMHDPHETQAQFDADVAALAFMDATEAVFTPARIKPWSPVLTLSELMSMTEAQREFLSLHSGGKPITRMLTASAILAHWTCSHDVTDGNGITRCTQNATPNLTPQCDHTTAQHTDRCF
jgi:hypothetical protein